MRPCGVPAGQEQEALQQSCVALCMNANPTCVELRGMANVKDEDKLDKDAKPSKPAPKKKGKKA